MSSYRRSEIVSGLFVVLAAVVFGLFAFKVGRFDLMGLLKDDAITCRAYFPNVKTLQVGSKVRVGGREVGEVIGLVLVEGSTPPATQDPGGLERLVNEVTFELMYPELRLDAGSARVRLAQESLLAPHFLELDPGRWPANQPPATLFEADLPDVVVIAFGSRRRHRRAHGSSPARHRRARYLDPDDQRETAHRRQRRRGHSRPRRARRGLGRRPPGRRHAQSRLARS